jgi:hypothetical protein
MGAIGIMNKFTKINQTISSLSQVIIPAAKVNTNQPTKDKIVKTMVIPPLSSLSSFAVMLLVENYILKQRSAYKLDR